MANTPTIESLIAAWVRAFNAHDLDSHAALYTPDATLFGSKPTLSVGRDAIRGYFAKVGTRVRVARYHEPRIAKLGEEAAALAAYVDFVDGETPSPYRMTWALARRGGDWLIAQHHGSPRLEDVPHDD